jgi:hypothetical protein
LATSLARTSWRMGRLSIVTTGSKLPCSFPFKCCMVTSFKLIARACLLFTAEAEFCQMSLPKDRATERLDLIVLHYAHGGHACARVVYRTLD